MAVFLAGQSGPVAGQQWRLQPGALTLGSADGCDIHLPDDPQVQPIHAALQVSAREITIAGRPGAALVVDGVPATGPVPLRPGSRVQIGLSVLRLEQLALEPTRPPAPPPALPQQELGLALPPPDPPRWPLVLSVFGAILAVAAVALIWRLVPERVQRAEEQFPADTLARIKQSTVWISVDQGRGEGSGFVLRQGKVITNAHVVEGSREVQVIFGSGTPQMRRVPARVLRTGRPGTPSDVAVLSCETGNVPALPLADLKLIREGTTVAAFGYPLGSMVATNRQGPNISVRGGKVTAIRYDDHGRPEWVEADIAAEVGNSGGPVVTTDGKVVGLATMILGSHLKVTVAVPATRIAELAGR